MDRTKFYVVLSLLSIVYVLLNAYLIRRGRAALRTHRSLEKGFLLVVVALAAAYPLGRVLHIYVESAAVDLAIRLGSLYLGMMLYALLFVAVIDLVRLANTFAPVLPVRISQGPQAAQVIFWTVVSAVGLATLVGYSNATVPSIRSLDLAIGKPAGALKELTIVAATDIHFGTVVDAARLGHLVQTINGLRPDLVLLVGDSVDESVTPDTMREMSDVLRGIDARYGTYAVTGNHEYFAGVAEAVRYLEQGGVTVLQDKAVKIADALYLVGRKDFSAEGYGDRRVALASILEAVDRRAPTILMDHQPRASARDEASDGGVDLLLSGHTHAGQLWPLNYVSGLLFDETWGYGRKGAMQFYVSSGVGTWGPEVRLGNHPEIVKIRLRFL